MTWVVTVTCESREDAEAVASCVDMAAEEGASGLDQVGGLLIRSFEVCERDHMAGKLCALEAEHDGPCD